MPGGMSRERDRRRPGDRPAQPHALRRGLRDLPVRRGVAVRRGDPLLPAGAGGGARPDDDGDAGAGRPARGRGRRASACAASWSSGGSAPPRPTCAEVPAECRAACEGELRALPARAGAARRGRRRPAARRSSEAAAEGRVALAASAATHAVLPLLATREGLRLQLDAGIRSHRRRFGWDGGFWLPECAYVPGLEWRAGRARGALVLRRPERARASRSTRWRRSRTEAGPVALPIDWEAISWLWSLDGYPSDPAHAQFAGKSLRGIRHLEGRRRRLRPGRGRGGGPPPGRRVPRRRRRAAARLRRPSAAAAACSSSRSTPSCSATGGRRGRSGCEAVLDGAEAAGVAPAHRAARRSPSTSRSSARCRLDLGRGEGPAHLGLAAGRRPRLGGPAAGAAPAAGARRRPARRRRRRAPRASCSPSRRATGPSSTSAARPATTPSSAPPTTREAMLEAIDSDRATDPRMRSLAPDLSLAPLLEP